MYKSIRRATTFMLALIVSCLAAAMAWASAMQRATSSPDKMLLAALSIVIVLAVHLLPVLLHGRRRLVLWPLWVLCLVLAGFGHASWFYRTGASATEARLAGSSEARAVAQERATIEKVLSTISARPVTIVASLYARSKMQDRREALATELAEANREVGLQDRLIELSRSAAGSGSDRREHTVPEMGTAKVWSETLLEHDVTLFMSVLAAVAIEVLGALLWTAALADDDIAVDSIDATPEPVRTVAQNLVNLLVPVTDLPTQVAREDAADELADLRAAIVRGDCRETVRSIRDYMGCAMERAAHLRRQLVVR